MEDKLGLLNNSEKWYTVEELAELTGYSTKALMSGNSPLTKLSIALECETRTTGYHNTQKLYSANVLKALKEYQVKNGAPNALKDKQTVLEGNTSYIGNIAVNSLLDSPEALLTLINASAKKLLMLQKENEQQKQQLIEQQPKVEMYDDLVDRKYLKNFRDFAQMQGISQTKLMDFLRSKYIYKNVGGEYRAYAEYSDMFELRAFQKGKDKIGNQLLLNLKGIQYFGNLLASTLGK